MAIGMVEMQGVINRTQDYQQLQQFDNEKGLIYQNHQQQQVDQNVEHHIRQVHEKDDAGEDNTADGGDGKQYASGRNGKAVKKPKPEGRIVEKSTMAFDIKI
ncbi:MAG: hypothetical protein IK115_09105 [Lachnospiraceae bacterium]|nr:hypothetical protein [Lachnospiraceae bacterium]